MLFNLFPLCVSSVKGKGQRAILCVAEDGFTRGSAGIVWHPSDIITASVLADGGPALLRAFLDESPIASQQGSEVGTALISFVQVRKVRPW